MENSFQSIIVLAFVAFILFSFWKMFEKAGRPGWEAIIPIYNIYILITKIAQLPAWYIFLFFIPLVNIYAVFKVYITIAHKFGKGTGFGIGLVFLSFIFVPILAFGDAVYQDNQLELEDNLIG